MLIRNIRRGSAVRFLAALGHEAGEGRVEAVTDASVMVSTVTGLIEFRGYPVPDNGPGAFLGMSLSVPLEVINELTAQEG